MLGHCEYCNRTAEPDLKGSCSYCGAPMSIISEEKEEFNTIPSLHDRVNDAIDGWRGRMKTTKNI